MSEQALLRVDGVSKTFEVRGTVSRRVTRRVFAIRDLSFEVGKGEAVGLVGESGSGKTTAARCALGLEQVSSGQISFDGTAIDGMDKGSRRTFRREAQAVFQDPRESLSPRLTAHEAVMEPLIVHRVGSRSERRDVALSWLERVGIAPEDADKVPARLSGGQRQRVSIARSLVLEPKFLVLDEPTSALDLSVQAQILNLLRDLQEQTGVSYLLISHNLGAVANVCSRVVVMYAGLVMESGPTVEVLSAPLHPYTRALILASDEETPAFEAGPVVRALQGAAPSPTEEVKGCPFTSRCSLAMEICATTMPRTIRVGENHQVACHAVEHLADGGQSETPVSAGGL